MHVDNVLVMWGDAGYWSLEKDKPRRSARAAKWAVCGHDDKSVHATINLVPSPGFFQFAAEWSFISSIDESPYVLCTWEVVQRKIRAAAFGRRKECHSTRDRNSQPTPSLVVHSITARSTGIGCRRWEVKWPTEKGVFHHHRRRRRHPGRRDKYVVVRGGGPPTPRCGTYVPHQ
jgi:hypothetical protein